MTDNMRDSCFSVIRKYTSCATNDLAILKIMAREIEREYGSELTKEEQSWLDKARGIVEAIGGAG